MMAITSKAMINSFRFRRNVVTLRNPYSPNQALYNKLLPQLYWTADFLACLYLNHSYGWAWPSSAPACFPLFSPRFSSIMKKQPYTFDQRIIPLYDIWKKKTVFCVGIPLSFQFATEFCMISLLMLFIFNRQWYLVIPVDVVPRLILGRKQIKCNELS